MDNVVNFPDAKGTLSKFFGSFKKGIFGVILILVVAILLSSSWYTVAESEQGVVVTLGKVTKIVNKNGDQAGLHFKLPFPIQKVYTPEVRKTRSLEFGFREYNGRTEVVKEEALMLTGDENIVWADAIIEYRISDVKQWLFNVEHGNDEQVLRNAVAASVRGIIGSSSLDSALTNGKVEIQNKTKEHLENIVEKYGMGIQIIAVKLQDVTPPSEEVQTAFNKVNDAREQQNTVINQAEKYKNDKLPKAKGDAKALLEQAEGNKTARINEAKGDVAKFKALYEEYRTSKGVTRSRILLETLDEVLPGAKIFIMDDSAGGTVKYLPLREIENSKQGGGQ